MAAAKAVASPQPKSQDHQLQLDQHHFLPLFLADSKKQRECHIYLYKSIIKFQINMTKHTVDKPQKIHQQPSSTRISQYQPVMIELPAAPLVQHLKFGQPLAQPQHLAQLVRQVYLPPSMAVEIPRLRFPGSPESPVQNGKDGPYSLVDRISYINSIYNVYIYIYVWVFNH